MTVSTKTIYVAFNGVPFDTEEDCCYYETAYKSSVSSEDLCLLDDNLHILDLAREDAYDDSVYMFVGSECGLQLVKDNIFDTIDNHKFPDKIGIWKYDYDHEAWIDLSKRVKTLIETIEIIKSKTTKASK